MSVSCFKHDHSEPTDSEFRQALAESILQAERVIGFFNEQCEGGESVWKMAYKKAGWSIRLVFKKRNICYLVPHCESFSVVFVYGDKAVNAVNECDAIPVTVKDDLNAARKYAEGRGIQIHVNTGDSVDYISKMIAIKLAN